MEPKTDLGDNEAIIRFNITMVSIDIYVVYYTFCAVLYIVESKGQTALYYSNNNKCATWKIIHTH